MILAAFTRWSARSRLDKARRAYAQALTRYKAADERQDTRKMHEATAPLAHVVGSKTRVRIIAWPRQHVMSALLSKGYNPTAIGRFLKADHSTVLHGDFEHRKRQAWADFIMWCAEGSEQPDLFARAA